MREILNQIIGLLNESSVYLMLGFLLAGVLHVVLTRFPRVTALFTGSGSRPVFMSTLLGLPMPLCSCSVLPAAMTLRRKGAGKGATASFLISVPETDIVSIMLTLALLGGVMAIYRPAAAMVTALIAGLVINALEWRMTKGKQAQASAPGESAAPHCGCDNEESKESDSFLDADDAGPWYRRVLRYGFVKIFDDIVAQLFIGILIAGVLMAWLPGIEIVSDTRGAVWTYAVMLVIGVPVYVCAVASTPMAVGLIAGGVSPGAAMVFLLAGPATNIASLFVLKGEFGKRILAVYLLAIMVGSVAAGVLFDVFLGTTVTAEAVAQKHHHHGASPLEITLTIAFLLLTLLSFHRTNLAGKIKTRILRLVRNP
jgi:uncharacterized membrane protein YraQ (UPF0718 family)